MVMMGSAILLGSDLNPADVAISKKKKKILNDDDYYSGHDSKR